MDTLNFKKSRIGFYTGTIVAPVAGVNEALCPAVTVEHSGAGLYYMVAMTRYAFLEMDNITNIRYDHIYSEKGLRAIYKGKSGRVIYVYKTKAGALSRLKRLHERAVKNAIAFQQERAAEKIQYLNL